MNDAPIIIEPPEEATAAIIWLHGLGADGHDFEPVVPYLGSAIHHTRFVFPHAPIQPVTINGGVAMRAWYDILSMDIDRRVDVDGVRASEAVVVKLIEAERQKGIPASRIVLAGFSQGGAIALHAGVRFGEALAGLMALSTYVVTPEHTAKEAHPANKETPIFMAHGTSDPVVALAMAERSRAHLEELGYAIGWRTYPMEHSVSPEELADIATWLSERLPAL